VGLLGACLAGVAVAQTGHAELLRQRQAVQMQFERELQACQSRFAVTACVNDARARHQATDAPLREALLLLDAQSRQQRAAERRRAVAQKRRDADAQSPAASAPTAGR
jgi:hypothetical protein